MKTGNRDWLRIAGGGCFINTALTGILVGLASTTASFSVDTIALPFLAGATISFGISLYLVRATGGEMNAMRKVILAGAGVLIGSIFAVLGIAALLILPGG